MTTLQTLYPREAIVATVRAFLRTRTVSSHDMPHVDIRRGSHPNRTIDLRLGGVQVPPSSVRENIEFATELDKYVGYDPVTGVLMGDVIKAAIEDYVTDILDKEWPDLRQADEESRKLLRDEGFVKPLAALGIAI
jgi:hypothetical protein